MKKQLIKIMMLGALGLMLSGCGMEQPEATVSGLEGEPISSELFSNDVPSSPQEKQAKDPAEIKAMLEGTWVCGRASMEIEFDEENQAEVTILWAGSAFEASEWNYTCTFDGKALMNGGTGKKAYVVYAQDDEDPARTVEYSDGAASFLMDEEGFLLWADQKENIAEGMKFEKIEMSDLLN